MHPKKVYMVGIGGIGMSSLAQLYAHAGATVLGSDRAEQPSTEMLRKKGVEVLLGHSASHVPEDADLLVYSDAIVEGSDGYPERVRGRELGIPELSYFEALGKVAEGKRVVAISGTNGKTTTTAMLGKILVDAGEDPTVVVGSIVSEWGSNFRAGRDDLFIVEACEYKKHFLNFHPSVLVVTNIELDHTDYFKNEDAFVAAFGEAVANVVPGGDIIANTALPNVEKALEAKPAHVRVVNYAEVDVPGLLLPGEFNRENARAAKAAAHIVAPHLSDAQIDASLAAFPGTWRRFEYKGTLPKGAMLYDDYAHHPTAISKTIAGARERFPGKKIVVFFHPHLYSRTRDLFPGFVESLATADEAYILPVFAAREPHDESVSNVALAEAITSSGGKAHALSGLEETAEKLQTLGPDTVAFTMGAGNVYKAGEDALGIK